MKLKLFLQNRTIINKLETCIFLISGMKMENTDSKPTVTTAESGDMKSIGGAATSNFIRAIIDDDLKTNKWDGRVQTRFPPEPNGYLHIGHAKAICLSFGFAMEFNGKCNLRFDDTNPTKEDQEYVDSIMEDVHWLGFNWDNRFYASDYYDKLYEYAVELIKMGKAFVCQLNADEMRKYRGTLTESGSESPWRNRSVDENLALFERMKNGEFADGEYTLRAKIDMTSPNINMRDPVIYRIKHATHHRTGDKWCIYPMYDYTHCVSDSLERITHSICTLEFEDHRPLYDWFLDQLKVYHPQQIEFARLNISYTVMSKRKLLELVEKKYVSGWDDPRMPTICGMRRRGYTPEAIRNFAERIGVAKKESLVDISLLEFCVREDLNKKVIRVMGVVNPLRVVIDNYPDDLTEELDAVNNPEDPSMGTRKVPFSRTILVERDDFMEDPPKKFYRLSVGREVRLRYAYLITCNEVIKDDNGEIVELHCSYDPETRGGNTPDGRKVQGTIHWVSEKHAYDAEVRLYDNLFKSETPGDVPEGMDWKDDLNQDSLKTVTAKVEPSLKDSAPAVNYQFERIGYFYTDPIDSQPGKPVFNRTVTLRDTWAKMNKK